MKTKDTLQLAGTIVAAVAVYKLAGAVSSFGAGGDVDPTEEEVDMTGTTLPFGTLLFMAAGIQIAVFGGSGWQLTEDEKEASRLILMCNNDADLIALLKVYGCRRPPFHIGCKTLRELVRDYFSSKQRADLNAALADKGITLAL